MAVDFNSLAGAFRIKYKKDFEDNRLGVCPLLDSVPFQKQASSIAQEMDIPIALTVHSGNTAQVAGASGALLTPVPAQVKFAKVTNFEIVCALDIGLGTLEAVANGSDVSYLDPSMLKMFELNQSIRRDQELSHLHGQTGLGQVSAVGAVTLVSGSTYQVLVTISAATWSSGIWKFAEGSPWDVYSALTAGTKRNANLPCTLGGGNVAGQLAVNPATKQIVLTGNTTDLSAIAVNDYLFRTGFYATEAIGLKLMLSQTAGTLFNIVQGSYSAFRATQSAVGGAPLSFAKIASGIAEAVSGALKSDMDVHTSPKSFANLLTDQAGLRRYGARPGKFDNGAEGVEFYSETGKVNVISNPYVMEGDAFGFPTKGIMRVGTTDPTDTIAGVKLQVVSSTNASVRFLMFAGEQIFIQKLATCVYWSGIVPNV